MAKPEHHSLIWSKVSRESSCKLEAPKVSTAHSCVLSGLHMLMGFSEWVANIRIGETACKDWISGFSWKTVREANTDTSLPNVAAGCCCRGPEASASRSPSGHLYSAISSYTSFVGERKVTACIFKTWHSSVLLEILNALFSCPEELLSVNFKRRTKPKSLCGMSTESI